MYSGALKKQVLSPTARLVPLDEYEPAGRPWGFVRRPPRPEPARPVASSFVLFYAGLRDEAAKRGLLATGSASDLWLAAARCAHGDDPEHGR